MYWKKEKQSKALSWRVKLQYISCNLKTRLIIFILSLSICECSTCKAVEGLPFQMRFQGKSHLAAETRTKLEEGNAEVIYLG